MVGISIFIKGVVVKVIPIYMVGMVTFFHLNIY